jgi:hypothetical protein
MVMLQSYQLFQYVSSFYFVVSLGLDINKNFHIKGLFWRIHQMEPVDFYLYFIFCIIGATYLIAFAYKNVKFVLKHK